jgi:hypothetical protein
MNEEPKIGCVNHDCDQCKAVQEPVAHPVIAGALFDFMGWLTSRKETLILSSADNASPAVEAITEFAKMRGLSLDGARVQDWQDTTPPATPVQEPVCHICNGTGEMDSGGTQPWGEAINIPCECTAPPAPQPVPVKTYHDGNPWPVQQAPDPVPIIQQLVTALEGSGTRMRSDQWYVEIEAVAAGKFYLNSKGANHD